MKPASLTYPLHFFGLILLTTIVAQADSAFAQASNIVPDNTLGTESSVVNPRDATSESIDGGAVRGQNLFHSFEEFNVGEDRGVDFANPDAVTNIFSRVTGNDVSNILGTLGVDGAANLFLINPNGIVFGEGASLNVQGSFTATTADGIEFGEQGFFSAVNPIESVLTISVPLGLQFGSNPGSIINRSYVEDSTGEFVGLQVPDGEDLTLLGGDVSFEAGEVTARGGDIQIGGLGAAGKVTFNDDGSLNFPENVARTDLIFSGEADVDVRGTGGGSVNINARNLNLEAGELGFSQIRAGITADSTSTKAQAGDIRIDATDNVIVDDSSISNQVNSEAEGNAGSITITTGSLALTNGGRVDATTKGTGNAGRINITATDTVTIDGEDFNAVNSGAYSVVASGAEGNAGGLTISTGSLTLTNGGRVDASTFGQGNAGGIEITANDNINFDGMRSNGFVSGAFSAVDTEALGEAGRITITTSFLTLTNGGIINSSTSGIGDAGGVEITATDNITFDGVASEGFYSGVVSLVNSEKAVGNAGEIAITTGSLTLTNGGRINSSTLGIGNAGGVEITATDSITFDGVASEGFNSGVLSQVGSKAEGNAGGITINTGSLTLTNGGQVDASTLGQGNAGKVEITATDSITFDGVSSDGLISGTASAVAPEAKGNSGGITINTGSLTLTNGGQVFAGTLGQGNAGELEISANSLNLDNDAAISSRSKSTFDAGDITLNVADSIQTTNSFISTSSTQSSGGNLTITAGDIQLRGDSDITTNILSGEGSGGNIAIEADSIIAFDDSDIFAFAAEGQGGNINLNTPAFFAENFTLNSLTANPDSLVNNSRADVNATGAVSGSVSIPDVSFIQNSLNNLPDDSINTDELVANSCVVPVGERRQGKFIITGGESLPVRPGNGIPSKYPTGEVRNVPQSNHSSWQPGEPIVEPQGAYRLANGKFVLSRECSRL